jgi:hypothetical protein
MWKFREREFALVMCASHWGLVNPEDKSFGFRFVPLSCCWFDSQTPIHILSKWVRQGVVLLFDPFLLVTLEPLEINGIYLFQNNTKIHK